MKNKINNLMGSEFKADNLAHALRKCDFSCHTKALQPQSVTVNICNLLLHPFKFTHAICHTQWLRTNAKLARSVYWNVSLSLYISRPLDFMAPFLCLPPSELTNQFQRLCFAWDPDGCEHTFTSHYSQSCKLMKIQLKLA